MGHLVAASEVAHDFTLDEVVFVPTGSPTQKERPPGLAAEDRYLMTVIATASNSEVLASAASTSTGGATYTIDMLRDLRAAARPGAVFFITGADALAEILSWHAADELFTSAHFTGCTSPGTAVRAGLPDGEGQPGGDPGAGDLVDR